jgi:threonine synthase
MKYFSTRGSSPALDLSAAIVSGVAPDGGLYVPEFFPKFQVDDFDGLESWSGIGRKLLRPFFKGDILEPHLSEICDFAFNFPIELKDLGTATAVLELFHGPTAAFKDVGARFLASCISKLPGQRTVLVATSGDTGSAVAAAFHNMAGTEVVILFPKGRVSARQQAQLTCWVGNVKAFSVLGDFDDCQRMVKAAFADPGLRKYQNLVSANSINLGRLLPQTVYYAAASLWYLRRHGASPGFIIPTGNLGNGVACFWAREMGFPIREIILAANQNHAVSDYFASGEWKPHPTIQTLANAMDVGNPSNMERLLNLYPVGSNLRLSAKAFSVGDQEISETIRRGATAWGEIWDPHTASAVHIREQLKSPDWVVVATAHPAKFESIVEPLIGKEIEAPASLLDVMAKASDPFEISPDLDVLSQSIGWSVGRATL